MRTYAKAGTHPTRRELDVARAIIRTDSMSSAAAELGMNERHLRVHLANLRVRLEARHNAELFLKLHDYLTA